MKRIIRLDSYLQRSSMPPVSSNLPDEEIEVHHEHQNEHMICQQEEVVIIRKQPAYMQSFESLF